MAPRETENNAYAKFWSDKQRALWYVMVFSGVVNWSNRELKQRRIWTAHVDRKWGLFHCNVPSCDATKFVLRLYFLLMNLLMNAESPLVIGVRRSKTPLLRTVYLWTNTTRTSGLNFRRLPVVNGSAFPEVPKQTRQPREVNPNFSKIFAK